MCIFFIVKWNIYDAWYRPLPFPRAQIIRQNGIIWQRGTHVSHVHCSMLYPWIVVWCLHRSCRLCASSPLPTNCIVCTNIRAQMYVANLQRFSVESVNPLATRWADWSCICICCVAYAVVCWLVSWIAAASTNAVARLSTCAFTCCHSKVCSCVAHCCFPLWIVVDSLWVVHLCKWVSK